MSRLNAFLLRFAGLSALAFCATMTQKSLAQNAAPSSVAIPVFVDIERRVETRPGLKISMIRFVTEDDYPPFNFVGADGVVQGFNVDLARLICAELSASCTIQHRRWDLLLPAVESGEADAVIASHRIDSDLRRRFELSSAVYRVPARFVGHKNGETQSVDLPALAGKTIGVVGGSRHETYLNALFPAVRIERYPTIVGALEAVRRRQIDLVFGDGVAIAFWLNGSESLECCRFVGGPFTEPRYFGEGAGIVFKKGNADLRQAVDAALWRINRDGRFARIYLKHFPVPFY
ncbi:HisJ ABC-type amino acid transport/signal transduction systems, periplasmic component/domain [Rhabdaerophilaceae bacterium]